MGRRRKGHLRSLRTHSERTQCREAGKEFSDCPGVCLTVSTLFTSLLNTAGPPPLRAASIMFTVGPPEPELHKSFEARAVLIRLFFFPFFFSLKVKSGGSATRGENPFLLIKVRHLWLEQWGGRGGGGLSQLLSRILFFRTFFLIRPQPRRGAHRVGSSQT